MPLVILEFLYLLSPDNKNTGVLHSCIMLVTYLLHAVIAGKVVWVVVFYVVVFVCYAHRKKPESATIKMQFSRNNLYS